MIGAMMQRLLFFLVLCLLLLPLQSGVANAAPLYNAYDLIAAVNQLRTGNGLQPYEINGTLMGIAQAHSSYQASIGNITHTGAGGTRPRDRAIAAGYSDGATVFISENIAGGTNLSVSTAISWWQGDAPHLNTMLGPNYTDVGAGMAVAGDVVYYTLDVGYVTGSAADDETPPPSEDEDNTGDTNTTQGGAAPVIVMTPREDGSVVHVVGFGQALWTIAVVYEVPLEDLLALNDLTENAFIFPGDELIVRPADQPTGTAIPPDSPSPIDAVETPTLASPVLRATEGPRVDAAVMPSPTDPVQIALVLPTQGDFQAPESKFSATSGLVTSWRGAARVMLVVLAAVAGGLVLISSLQDRKSEK